MAQHKALSSAVEVKAADRGEVEAVFATYNVIDRDGDVTFPGAFTEGEQVVISPWQHELWKGAPPVGEGSIHSRGDQALFRGRFYLGTTSGRDHFELVKARGGAQQWSYGYDVLHKPETVTFGGRKANALRKLKVHEVSPVFQGAGVGTTTLAVKSAFETLVEGGMDLNEAVRLVKETPLMTDYKAAIRPHETPVTVKSWDFLAAPDALSIDQLRSIHAWVDPAGDPAQKSSYGFLHHHGVGGDANLRACLAGIAELHGVKSAQLSPAERQAVHAHLAAHLEDGDRDVPGFDEAATGNLKFHEEAADVLARLNRFRVRTSEVMALRRSKGKTLSPHNIDVLDWIYDEMRGLKLLLDTPQEIAAEELARFIALTYDDELGESA